MSDRTKVHPRTAAMHNEWRLRALRRRDAVDARRVLSKQRSGIATVIAVDASGNVQIDRLTDADGNGEWLTPVNGRTPAVGQSVVVTDIEGALAVVGAVGEGTWQLFPDPLFTEPGDFLEGVQNRNYSNINFHPFLRVDPTNPRIFMGAPPFIAPNCWYWSDHFTSGILSNGQIGREGWHFFGTGASVSHDNPASGPGHTLTIATSSTSGQEAGIALSAPDTRVTIDPDDDIWEMWYVGWFSGSTTNMIFRFGLMNLLKTSGTPAHGVYFEAESGIGWAIRIRKSATNILNQVFDSLGSTETTVRIFSIRGEQSPMGIAYAVFTFTEWQWVTSNQEGNSGLFLEPKWTYQYTYEGPSDFGWESQPGILISPKSGNSRAVKVDYCGGWVYSNKVAFGGSL